MTVLIQGHSLNYLTLKANLLLVEVIYKMTLIFKHYRYLLGVMSIL